MVLGRVVNYHIQHKPQKRKVVVDDEGEPESEQELDGEEVRGLTGLNAGRCSLFANNFDPAWDG
jgi:hypothetical protein